ncbi:hypothetical protein SAMN02745857_00617 [Andreprevotia lacus DSM 23236]|jgi:hypothetical protein|uniref:Uncharacterized protein n=1 Tax=Andreprevotia lacus DSM 23236 TaxID=1121001 RepID=A0A1W1X5B0_9NEIS|nr:hypothetical protein [Andreprevotia lacus]SMC18993.1 hypothetical protein SAMN02745857_00617 [Andreprevotia lacus DSM 23236]
MIWVELISMITIIVAVFLLFFRGKTSLRGKHPLSVRRAYGKLLKACQGDRTRVQRLIDTELQRGAPSFAAAVDAALRNQRGYENTVLLNEQGPDTMPH